MRTFAFSSLTGVVSAAVVVDDDALDDYTVVGGRDIAVLVENRLEAHRDAGLPVDADVLRATLQGSYTQTTDWEPARKGREVFVRDTERIVESGELYAPYGL